MKLAVFMVTTLCVYRHFRGAYDLHLQGTARNMYSNLHGVFSQLKIITDFMCCVSGATEEML